MTKQDTSTSNRSGKVDVDTPTGKAVGVLINQRSDLRATLRTVKTLILHKPEGWQGGAVDLIEGILNSTENV